jgi:chromosome segregation ATPase
VTQLLDSLQAGAVAGLAIMVGILWWNLDTSEDQVTSLQQQVRGMESRAENAEAAASASEAYRSAERTLNNDLAEDLDEAQTRARELAAVASRLPALDASLRGARAEAFSCGQRLTAASASAAAAVQAADEAAELHAGLLERLGARQAERAGFAEKAAGAAAGCAASYDRLKTELDALSGEGRDHPAGAAGGEPPAGV